MACDPAVACRSEVDGWTLPFSIFVNDGAAGGVNDGERFSVDVGNKKSVKGFRLG